MGMFDTIKDELFCPFCGTKNSDFQTKDLSNFLAEWSIKEIKKHVDRISNVRIHDRCKNCKKWIQIIIEGGNNEES